LPAWDQPKSDIAIGIGVSIPCVIFISRIAKLFIGAYKKITKKIFVKVFIILLYPYGSKVIRIARILLNNFSSVGTGSGEAE